MAVDHAESDSEEEYKGEPIQIADNLDTLNDYGSGGSKSDSGDEDEEEEDDEDDEEPDNPNGFYARDAKFEEKVQKMSEPAQNIIKNLH